MFLGISLARVRKQTRESKYLRIITCNQKKNNSKTNKSKICLKVENFGVAIKNRKQFINEETYIGNHVTTIKNCVENW